MLAKLRALDRVPQWEVNLIFSQYHFSHGKNNLKYGLQKYQKML